MVDVVHAAIALAESLHDLPLLFPSSLVSAHHERPSSANARKGTTMNDDIQDLISWINFSSRQGQAELRSRIEPADSRAVGVEAIRPVLDIGGESDTDRHSVFSALTASRGT
ncbi:hypothetical protein ABT001_27630 [Streptomyces sp. NPDC002793]|uniref:hypothetical protein n=1 Tax=Streptomyces sp. NPDC002793 TaxID=3154432 RepID=UPI00332B909F